MDPGGPYPDEGLLRAAVLAGDEGAWKILYDRHFDALHAYARLRAGRDADLTDEAVQECWLTAVRRLPDFDPVRGSFAAWLRGIAENALRNLRRKARRAREAGAIDGAAEPAGREGSAAGRLELAEEIALALASLPERHQAVLRAKYEEGLSVSEIAERGGESLKSVESLLSRARAAFREVYERRRDGALS
jgi:RNA polymerase sigma-70 factor (ECF subfamily)